MAGGAGVGGLMAGVLQARRLELAGYMIHVTSCVRGRKRQRGSSLEGGPSQMWWAVGECVREHGCCWVRSSTACCALWVRRSVRGFWSGQ